MTIYESRVKLVDMVRRMPLVATMGFTKDGMEAAREARKEQRKLETNMLKLSRDDENSLR